MNGISWKAYHERCGRERLQGKRGATATDIVKDVLNARGREGATQAGLIRAVSMSTGIIADEVAKHWDSIEESLSKDSQYGKRPDGSWYRQKYSSGRMHLR